MVTDDFIMSLIDNPEVPNPSEWAVNCEAVFAELGMLTSDIKSALGNERLHNGALSQFRDSIVAYLKQALIRLRNDCDGTGEQVGSSGVVPTGTRLVVTVSDLIACGKIPDVEAFVQRLSQSMSLIRGNDWNPEDILSTEVNIDLNPISIDAEGYEKILEFVKEIKMKCRSVFIVHGHDLALRESVARFLEKQNIRPVILEDEENGGRTVLGKFEAKVVECGFAIILYTADDECAGGVRRARQNVVFEHGYILSKLGAENICVIMDKGVDVPSDTAAVAYIDKANWRLKLLKELRVAGFSVDANLL